MKTEKEKLSDFVEEPYKYGFETQIESDTAPKGLSEEIIRFISAKKNEPEWLLAFRLKSYQHWLTLKEPHWGKLSYQPIDYQSLYYYAAPKKNATPPRLDEVDP